MSKIHEYMDKRVKKIRNDKKGTVIRDAKSFPFDCYVRWDSGYEEYCDFYELELIKEI